MIPSLSQRVFAVSFYIPAIGVVLSIGQLLFGKEVFLRHHAKQSLWYWLTVGVVVGIFGGVHFFFGEQDTANYLWWIGAFLLLAILFSMIVLMTVAAKGKKENMKGLLWEMLKEWPALS